MKILTFDTALNKTYISLSEDDSIIEKISIENHDDKYHSAFLIKEISNVLKKNKLKMKDINAIGINVGPGSFTGIRACTTVGRVIAQQMDIALVPVSSLEILSRINKDEETAVILDARKESVYVGKYKDKKTLLAPQIIKINELTNILNRDTKVISDACIYKKLKEKNIEAVNYEESDYPLQEYLMNIVYEKLSKSKKQKDDYNWAKVRPLYIQPPSVFCK